MKSGALRFARYAFPPNELGYCGPDDASGLLELTSGRGDEGHLRHLAQGFAGAWLYLELIAHANGRNDPLDVEVVDAYWIGNNLLRGVPMAWMGRSVEDRFRKVTEPAWDMLDSTTPHGAVPHHSFHVFAVYPWLDLLRQGAPTEPLRILDRCRIRTGEIREVIGDLAIVSSRPLTWDGRILSVTPAVAEEVKVGVEGLGLAGPVAPGDRVTMHWDWVCEVVPGGVADRLERWNQTQLDMVNGLALPVLPD